MVLTFVFDTTVVHVATSVWSRSVSSSLLSSVSLAPSSTLNCGADSFSQRNAHVLFAVIW